MKLTAYRLTVLVLTNALTGLVAFAFGGGYANRMMEKKNEEKAKSSSKLRTVPDNPFMPSTIKEDIERGLFDRDSST